MEGAMSEGRKCHYQNGPHKPSRGPQVEPRSSFLHLDCRLSHLRGLRVQACAWQPLELQCGQPSSPEGQCLSRYLARDPLQHPQQDSRGQGDTLSRYAVRRCEAVMTTILRSPAHELCW